jgi:hypothetical protein
MCSLLLSHGSVEDFTVSLLVFLGFLNRRHNGSEAAQACIPSQRETRRDDELWVCRKRGKMLTENRLYVPAGDAILSALRECRWKTAEIDSWQLPLDVTNDADARRVRIVRVMGKSDVEAGQWIGVGNAVAGANEVVDHGGEIV